MNQKDWFSKGNLINGAGGVLDFGLTYADQRKQGHGVLYSGAAAALTTAAWIYMPGVMWGKTALDMAKAGGMAIEGIAKKSYEEQFAMNDQRGIVGRGFQDSEFGYTSRQRGMSAIQSSRLNARSALGGEARSLHRL